MPVLLDVNVTAMAGVELPPHPDRPSVRIAINPDNTTATVTLFTDTPSDVRELRVTLVFSPAGIMLWRSGYLKLLRYFSLDGLAPTRTRYSAQVAR